MRPLDLIPVPSALGAPDAGTTEGPEALRQAGLPAALHHAGLVAHWQSPVRPHRLPEAHDEAARWSALNALCTDLSDRVSASVRGNRMPLVIGGDHAIAAGTWRGVASALHGSLGLLWLDAHLDAHTPEDSVSANPHGMPLALLLGDGPLPLAHPTLSPAHVCVVGCRSWELPERGRLLRYGVRIIDQAEIAQRGLPSVLEEALDIVSEGTAGFGLSVDLDVFDPSDAPGVNSPVSGGTSPEQWFAALQGLARHPDCRALELVECDGRRDKQGDQPGRTAALGCRLMETLLAQGGLAAVA
jgi:arginase